ncbi:DNA cytosine methyltransferase [Methylobacterium sp. J-070]|uniref:DNA cytosine methyltransferase n=1 Tax=Methylobacterium sp. J-070 TaxID=2836650 RepID=UPI001FBBC7BB|nr:DNA cytosine methyltransferase [Methylobacterium sp. J-070]MCJ2048776.1 DNA cytosine methyltransferase [Methylobacterium sp. J-070]
MNHAQLGHATDFFNSLLGAKWRGLFANDVDPVKADAYEANWGVSDLRKGDVADVCAGHFPGLADLAWAAFPCQDLSLTGHGLGLGSWAVEGSNRSGTFWSFARIMRKLVREKRAPGTSDSITIHSASPSLSTT